MDGSWRCIDLGSRLRQTANVRPKVTGDIFLN